MLMMIWINHIYVFGRPSENSDGRCLDATYVWEDCWSSLKFNGAGTLVRRRRKEECEGSRLLREERGGHLRSVWRMFDQIQALREAVSACQKKGLVTWVYPWPRVFQRVVNWHFGFVQTGSKYLFYAYPTMIFLKL